MKRFVIELMGVFGALWVVLCCGCFVAFGFEWVALGGLIVGALALAARIAYHFIPEADR